MPAAATIPPSDSAFSPSPPSLPFGARDRRSATPRSEHLPPPPPPPPPLLLLQLPPLPPAAASPDDRNPPALQRHRGLHLRWRPRFAPGGGCPPRLRVVPARALGPRAAHNVNLRASSRRTRRRGGRPSQSLGSWSFKFPVFISFRAGAFEVSGGPRTTVQNSADPRH